MTRPRIQSWRATGFRHGIYGFFNGDMIQPSLVRLPAIHFSGCGFFRVRVGHPHAVLVVQALIDLAGCWLLWDCARREVSRRAGWAVLLLAVFCPFTAAYAVDGFDGKPVDLLRGAGDLGAGAAGASSASREAWCGGRCWRWRRRWATECCCGRMEFLLTAAFCAGILWYTRESAGARRGLAPCGGGRVAGGAAPGSVDDSELPNLSRDRAAGAAVCE